MIREPSPVAIAALAECRALLATPSPSAEVWLRGHLAAGPVPIEAAWADGLAAGFDDHQLDHAARRLGVRIADGDRWRLP